MKKLHLLIISLLIIFSGCSYSPLEPVEVETSGKIIDFLSDVKPVLDTRCVSCHSCYNAPCQAKFSSFDGIDRGGSKAKVYMAKRLFTQKTTRLFIDAKSTTEWRKKKFFSLIDSTSEAGYNHSIMAHMLYDKKMNPGIIGNYSPEYDKLACPATLEETSEYLNKKKNHGMPYGFPALDENEYRILMQWLDSGAKGPSQEQQKALEKPLDSDQKAINQWEEFLNRKDAKHVMTARYLYEHYYLAHINFNKENREFYKLVRSTTAPGEAIDTIATRRPYDDPQTDKFYYRFEKIYSTIVHKTHMVVKFSEIELKRINQLFINVPWLETPHVMTYDKMISTNPFLLYAQIPVASRYAFLLDHSEYIVRTFIRGPVCKGQIALNVIHDHFWVMFQDPQYDSGVQDPQFLIDQANNLSLPIEAGSSGSIYRVFSDRFRKKYSKYYAAKINKIEKNFAQGFPVDSIWKGEKASDAPALTIYRHFDSASVHKGFIGKLPRTMWVVDYAHLERIYYTLVAGFDVYGNVLHQTNVRRYMDFLRLEGELNFLFYMPQEKRVDILASWYIGDSIADDVQNDNSNISQNIMTHTDFKTDKPKQEFIENLVDTHFPESADVHFDEVNYFRIGDKIPNLPKTYKTKADVKQGLRALTAPGTGFIRLATKFGLNIMHLRILLNNGEDIQGSLVINRWHDNVNSLFREEKRLNSNKDTIDVIDGNIGSYPNVFMEVKEEDLPDFFDMLVNFENTGEYLAKLEKYAISRSDRNFWKYYDWFQNKFEEDEPLEAGLYDLNRYHKKPW